MAAPVDRTDSTLVIGLGRFGAAVAATLDRLGREVLAVETNPATVRQWTGRIPLVEADATDMEALEQLGATEFGTAVVGVATSIEASVLIAGNLVDLQTPQIWAKAISRAHGRILRRIGAHHVVYPEFDAGQRAAHLVSGRMLDYIEMEKGGFTIVKMRPPMELHHRRVEGPQPLRGDGLRPHEPGRALRVRHAGHAGVRRGRPGRGRGRHPPGALRQPAVRSASVRSRVMTRPGRRTRGGWP